jgi:hypothetical protein
MLYGCETWSLTLSKGHMLKVLASAFLKIKCGRKREKVTRVWRKLRKEELSNLCFSDIIIMVISSRMRLMGKIARRGEMKCIELFV